MWELQRECSLASFGSGSDHHHHLLSPTNSSIDSTTPDGKCCLHHHHSGDHHHHDSDHTMSPGGTFSSLDTKMDLGKITAIVLLSSCCCCCCCCQLPLLLLEQLQLQQQPQCALNPLISVFVCWDPSFVSFDGSGGKISRKLDFIPPLASVLSSGWTLPPAIAQATMVRMSRD